MKNRFENFNPGLRALVLKGIFALNLAIIGLTLCPGATKAQEKDTSSTLNNGAVASLNVLTASEKAAGWKLLFDGKTTSGWRGFRKKDFPTECWDVEDGILKRLGGKDKKRQECGDIITLDQYDNFELDLEWRILPGGNSGVKYLISEDRPSTWEQASAEYRRQELKKAACPKDEEIAKEVPEKYKYTPIGFEFQMIDDEKNADARKDSKRITGALYDLIAPSQRVSRPAGEFNQARILVNGNHVEHWINGVKVVEFERGSPELKAAIANSKFQHLEGFGTVSRGHIALQDHGDDVWFRNIKIRKLTGK